MQPIHIPDGLSDLPPRIARRVRIGASGRDCDAVPKVADAGRCFHTPDGPIQVMHNGVKVRLGGYHADWMARLIARLRGHHEPQEEKVFHELLPLVRPGGTMVEMGAYWAYYSLWFASAVPGARNVVCEPDPGHMAVARDNFKLNRREATFLQARSGDTSVARVAHPGVPGGVEQLSVDDLARRLGLDRIDVLHADIQGAELDLLRGAAGLIRDGRVRFVFLSTHHHSISGDPLTHQKCLRFLADHSAHVLAEHTVAESFSGDGLIVASFAAADRHLPPVQLTHNRAHNSLFAEPEADLAEARGQIEQAARLVGRLRAALPRWCAEPAAGDADLLTQLEAAEREVRRAARPLRSFLASLLPGATRRAG